MYGVFFFLKHFGMGREGGGKKLLCAWRQALGTEGVAGVGKQRSMSSENYKSCREETPVFFQRLLYAQVRYTVIQRVLVKCH